MWKSLVVKGNFAAKLKVKLAKLEQKFFFFCLVIIKKKKLSEEQFSE